MFRRRVTCVVVLAGETSFRRRDSPPRLAAPNYLLASHRAIAELAPAARGSAMNVPIAPGASSSSSGRSRSGSPFVFSVLGAAGAAVLGASWALCRAGDGHATAAKPHDATADDAHLPLISLEEVHRHRKDGDVWVTYQGSVYNVSGFIESHPGGKELILTAAGLDLEYFFENYKVHNQSNKANDYLQGMKIGRLSKEDAVAARQQTTPHVHVARRLDVLKAARRRMLLVLVTLPFFIVLRTLLRLIGVFLPPVVNLISGHLPVSVPGYGESGRIPPVDPATGKRNRVAVVGGGIAGCGAAWALKQSGFDVTLYEARKQTSGNARTFDWDVQGKMVKTCVSVTAWPEIYYKNYVALLKRLKIETAPMKLSWFLYSKVPGYEGFLWAADPSAPEGSLRKKFQKDFDRYATVIKIVEAITDVLSFQFLYNERSAYTLHAGLGFLNPFAVLPLWEMSRLFGVSREWWDIVFTPHYTASFLTDKLDNFPCVFGPAVGAQIPLLPTPENATNGVLTTCVTWAKGGDGIRSVFTKLNEGIDLRVDTRVLKVDHVKTNQIHVRDEHGNDEVFSKVIFACPVNAVGNMLAGHNWLEDSILAVPEYADDFHPVTGHMHSVMHNDATVIPEPFREEVLRKGSNYVEVTRLQDGTINIENTYNFGVQTPSLVDKPLSEKPPLLITHALGEGKRIDPSKIRGSANHPRAHPLWSGWNLSTVLSLRLMQGRRGMYYCANWTTPSNCHDMSFLSGLVAAHAVGAEYPFQEPENAEAKKDFYRLRDLMGV